MTKIKFGTDGWRAIIADMYTNDNLKRVALATAQYIKAQGGQAVVLGHDCRFAGSMFADLAARIFADQGLKVYLAQGFVSTPMVSLGVVLQKAFMGVVITASHNPPSYNGYKLKSAYGGPSIPAEVTEVEDRIADEVPTTPTTTQAEFVAQGKIEYIDLEKLYVEHCRKAFDIEAINNSFVNLAYDAMYGAGQNVVRQLIPAVTELHCDYNPSFMGQAPEPIHRNLGELSALLAQTPELNAGLANDGDADRIGMYDEEGRFVDSHQILLLLIHYLHKYKGLSGKVVVTFSVTDKVKKLCELYNLDCQVTKIGFKYIAEIMTKEEVLVGGEESGGIAATGHIPERDGIWIGLILLEFMAKTGKTLSQLMDEIYELVGPFAFNRDDLHLNNELKWQIVENCKAGSYSQFGPYKIQKVEDIDGFKFYLRDDAWVMIRPSGTEPVLRVYAQAPTDEEVRQILDATKAALLEG